MNLDSLITVAGLFVAVLAIIPRVRRLEISIRFGMFGWLIVLVSFVSVIYLQFYQTFRTLGFTPNLNLARWSITTSNASFLVLLFMCLILYSYLKIKSLSRSNVIKFRELVLELSREARYSELLLLVERHLHQIERLYSANFLGSRLRSYFLKYSYVYPTFFSLDESSNDKKEHIPKFIQDRVSKVKKVVFSKIANILPSYGKQKDAAEEIISEVLLNREIVKAIATIRPYFALKILQKDFYENKEFVDYYLRCLAEDTKSILYREVQNNQNLKRHDEFDILERNKLLYFFFSDCNVAEQYAPYKGIGDFVLYELDNLYSKGSLDPYNGPMDNFYDDGQWSSPLLISIRFFDIMVTSALYQNIKWHMWLYYFPLFVDKILRNLSPNQLLVDLDAEWPTRYHYALYIITSCLCKWSFAVDHIPTDQENVVLETTSATHENGNIPKSSMLALGQVTKHILTSLAITDRFKRYIMEMVYRRYFKLRQVEKTKNYAEALLNAIRNGGYSMMRSSNREYKQALIDTFSAFDTVPYESVLCDELQSILTQNIDNEEA